MRGASVLKAEFHLLWTSAEARGTKDNGSF
jgi:hypothetical protein